MGAKKRRSLCTDRVQQHCQYRGCRYLGHVDNVIAQVTAMLLLKSCPQQTFQIVCNEGRNDASSETREIDLTQTQPNSSVSRARKKTSQRPFETDGAISAPWNWLEISDQNSSPAIGFPNFARN